MTDVLDATAFALDTIYAAMGAPVKRKRLPRNVLEVSCPGCDAEDADDPATIQVTVDYEPGCRDYAASRSFTATGCHHVEPDDGRWDQAVEDAIDDEARVMGERERGD